MFSFSYANKIMLLGLVWAAEHRIHLRGCLAFGAHHDMRVQVGGDGYRAVAQDLLDHLELEALS